MLNRNLPPNPKWRKRVNRVDLQKDLTLRAGAFEGRFTCQRLNRTRRMAIVLLAEKTKGSTRFKKPSNLSNPGKTCQPQEGRV